MHDGTEEREAQKRTKNILNKNKMLGLNHPELYCSISHQLGGPLVRAPHLQP